MDLMAPLEALDEAAGQNGLRRLVKGGQKRQRTPEASSPSVQHTDTERPAENKRPKTGLKLKIKLNGNVVARAATPQSGLPGAIKLGKVLSASRQAELDSFGLPDDKLLRAFQPQWASTPQQQHVPQLPAHNRDTGRSEQREQEATPGETTVPVKPILEADELKRSSPVADESSGAAAVPTVAALTSHTAKDQARLAASRSFDNVPTPFQDQHQPNSSPLEPQKDETVDVTKPVELRGQADGSSLGGSQSSITQIDSLAVLLPAGAEKGCDNGPEGQPKPVPQQQSSEPEKAAVDQRVAADHVADPAFRKASGSKHPETIPAKEPETSEFSKVQSRAKEEPAKAGTAVTRTAPSKEPKADADAQASSSSGDSTSSSSTSSSSSSDSGNTENRRSIKRRRTPSPSPPRSRSREAGEHSADEYPAGKRPDSRGHQSRHGSPVHRHRSRSRSGYDHRSRSRWRDYDHGRRYDSSRRDSRRQSSVDRDGRRRYDVGRDDRRRSEANEDAGRVRPRSTDREGRRHTPSSRHDGDDRPRSTNRSRLEDSRRQGSKRRHERITEPERLQSRVSKEASDIDRGQPSKGVRRSPGQWGRVPSRPEAQTKPIGFADAWNMLHGAGRESCGNDADIDDLHAAATSAKRNIENLSKATNGKHTFENLVALMRESYLKYMQVGCIWEAMIRMPNANPNRSRAKLADEGGLFPQTITLMRQIAADCRSCPANTEASKILRCLAERLSAIIQMRIIHIQRAKVAQDRHILLGCKGAPRVDVYGRKLPDSDLPGETYQRPSPTDSNASNNTSEQAIQQTPSPSYSRSLQAKPLSNAARASGPAIATAVAQATKGLKGGKLSNERRTTPGLPRGDVSKGRTSRNTTPVPTGPGRDDAWAVEPLPWEIPPKHFDSEMRSWGILGGFMNFTAAYKSQVAEVEGLMQANNENVREAAGMLGFLDLGIGLTNMGAIMQLAQNILSLVLKIQNNSPETPAKG